MCRPLRTLAFAASAFALPAILGAAPPAVPFHVERYSLIIAVPQGGSESSANVEVPGAAWLRLRLKAAALGAGGTLELTSLRDGGRQRLDAERLAEWRNATAYFNGDSVELRVRAAPGGAGAFAELEAVEVGEWAGGAAGTDSVCGPTDDRMPSAHPAVARLMNAGCTGWIAASGRHVTAGHCAGHFANVLEFDVPPSNPDGTVNHPPPEDQYAVDAASMVSSSTGIGDDWGVFEVFPNPITGLLPIQAQGAAFVVARSSGSPTLRVTGHGRDADDPALSQTQQTHAGPNRGVRGTVVRFVVDTATGSSGSPVIDDSLGVVIGHYTAGGCTAGGGVNSGTSTFNERFWRAVNRPAGGNQEEILLTAGKSRWYIPRFLRRGL